MTLRSALEQRVTRLLVYRYQCGDAGCIAGRRCSHIFRSVAQSASVHASGANSAQS